MNRNLLRVSRVFCLALAFLFPALVLAEGKEVSVLVTNAVLIDGTGAPAARGSLRFRGARIVEVGQLSARPGETVIDAGGRVLAPGFIDTHTHHIDAVNWDSESQYLPDLPDALSAVSQGVTTSIVGQDGRSYLPIGGSLAGLEESGVAINVASYVGHGSIRLAVMGDDFRRAATGDEVDAMIDMVVEAMQDGALGLSTGLEYNPGIYATSDEVHALAKAAAHRGGRYITHIRSEDRGLWESIEEALLVGEATGMPVQISHAKLGMKALWGQADRYLGKLEEARARGINVSVDVYPYTFWQTTLTILFPDRDYGDLEAARYALEQVVAPEDIRFVVYRPDPSLEGRTLAEIAMERNEPSEETLISLIVDSPTPEDFELVLMEAMSQNDVDQLLAWPHANICSDGHLADRHPRGAGAFTRVLRYHVREKGLLSLEEAIHKMTGLAAAHMGLSERGLLRAGYFADMVLFDPAIVADQSTVENPQALSSGIDRVWVNGEKVYEETKSTGLRPGRFLRHIQGT